AGDISIGGGDISMSGHHSGVIASGGARNKSSPAGSIRVTAANLSVTTGAGIASDALGNGPGGSLTISATGKVSLDGGEFVASTLGASSAGSISVTAAG